MSERTELLLVIDTDGWAGNYEREMAAYCTGVLGVTSKGRLHAEDLVDELEERGATDLLQGLRSLVRTRLNDRGADEAGHIHPTPGRVNDGHGNRMDASAFKGDVPFPAFESVAIHLTRLPTPVEAAFIRERVAAFAAGGHHSRWKEKEPLNILAIRLIERRTVVTETEVPLPGTP